MAHLFLSITRVSLTAAVALFVFIFFILSSYVVAFEALPNSPKRTHVLIDLSIDSDISYEQKVESILAKLIKDQFPHASNAAQVAFWVRSASEAHNIDPMLHISLIAQESSFRTDVESHAGAIGLGQVIPKYWEQSCGLDVDDPFNNVWCSAHALKENLTKYEDIPRALAVYNVGATNYRRSYYYREAGHRYAYSVLNYRSKFETSKRLSF